MLYKLRDYQEKIFDKAIEVLKRPGGSRASVILPTGGGKTEIFLHLLQEVIKTEEEKIILMVYPRIALADEQLRRYEAAFPGEFRTQFHSGEAIQQTKFKKADLKRLSHSTTSIDKLVKILDNSGVNIKVIFTTYHSLDKVAHLGDLVIFDEAHNIVLNRAFSPSLNLFKSESKLFFFTATPVKKGDLDMDDVEEFGENIANVLPIELIERGYIVPPKMLVAEMQTKAEKSVEDAVLNIHEVAAATFKDQAARVRAMSNNKLVPKLLVAAKGTRQFRELHKQLSKIREICGEVVDVYTVTAGQSIKNGAPRKSRASMIDEFNLSKIPSIIVHYDTLAEGIDVAGLSGVLILRELSKTKFLQTIGRCLRPFTTLDYIDGEPIAKELRVKKHAFVSIPLVNDDDRWIKLAQVYANALTNYGDRKEIFSEVLLPDGDLDDEEDDYYDGLNKKPDTLKKIIFQENQFDALSRFFNKQQAVISCAKWEDVQKKDRKAIFHKLFMKLYTGEFRYTETSPIVEGAWVGHENGSFITAKTFARMTKNLTVLPKKDAKVLIMCSPEMMIYLKDAGYTDVTLMSAVEVPFLRDLAERSFGYKYITREELVEKNMKFDAIIGNPPYQGTAELHQQFFNMAVDHLEDNGHMCFIQPSTPYESKKIPERAGKKMQDNIRKYVVDVEICDFRVFPSINGGYTHLAITNLTKTIGAETIRSLSYMNGNVYKNVLLEAVNFLETEPTTYLSIRKKIEKMVAKNGSLDDILSYEKISGAYLPGLNGSHITRFVALDNAYHGDVMDMPAKNPLSIQIPKEQYASFYSYVKSFVARYSLMLTKNNGHQNRGELVLVPIVPFDRIWDDKQLAKLFGITDSELKVIQASMPDDYKLLNNVS